MEFIDSPGTDPNNTDPVKHREEQTHLWMMKVNFYEWQVVEDDGER